MAPFDGKYLISYLMAIVTFALSITICEILTNIIKCPVLTLKMKVEVKKYEEWDWRHLTGNVQLRIDDFFQNFSYLGTCLYKLDTYIHTHIHMQQGKGVITIGKIFKADLPNNN